MNILIDYHHGSLFKSMGYLLKKRLQYNVYAPVGDDWLIREKLYSHYPDKTTPYQMLNSWESYYEYNRICPIKLSEFVDSNIDVIVCTLLENYSIFRNILEKYNKKCKLVLHIGNNHPPDMLERMCVKNLWSTSWCTFIKSNIKNKVFTSQEFSVELFTKQLTCNIKSIINLKHMLNDIELNILTQIKDKLPRDWVVKMYGVNNKDGVLHGTEENYSTHIKNCGFVYHVKYVDEGYGHNIHNAFACGKPVITDSQRMGVNWNGEFIKNSAHLLFEDDVNIIDVSKNSIDDIVNKLVLMSNNYEYYSNTTYDIFNKKINFDDDSIKIKIFLNNLI